MTAIVVLSALAFVPMSIEARRSAANDRRLRAKGAIEPASDVYRLMQFAYPGCFLAMIAEAWLRGAGTSPIAVVGAVIFGAAKALKYWAIAALGERWTFRVLVPPGSDRIVSGPYAYLRHPNYLAVAGELLGFAILARAPIAGTIAVACFGALMAARIRVEERALGVRTR